MILELEKQVASLEWAQRMEKLGFPQDGCLWYWVELRLMSFNKRKKGVAAPSCAEMGEVLPEKIKDKRLLWISKIDNEWSINYAKHTKDGEPYSWLSPCNWSADTEVNARCAMWCYLKEEGLL